MEEYTGTIGETPEHAWLVELLNRAFPETGRRVSADFQLIMTMCKAEPKAAQYGMQFLAQEVRKLRNKNKDPASHEKLSFTSFALGALFTAYSGLAVAAGIITESDLYPPELEMIVRTYPEVLECAEALPPI